MRIGAATKEHAMMTGREVLERPAAQALAAACGLSKKCLVTAIRDRIYNTFAYELPNFYDVEVKFNQSASVCVVNSVGPHGVLDSTRLYGVAGINATLYVLRRHDTIPRRARWQLENRLSFEPAGGVTLAELGIVVPEIRL